MRERVAKRPIRTGPSSPAGAALRQAWRPLAWRWGPLAVAALLLLLGYLHYAPGTAYSLSADHYRAYAFPAFRYSDLIWLYLRDGLADRPIPYLDYPLEYPPLTGLLSYALSWAPDLPTNYLWSYALLALCGLGTVAALRSISGANPWVYAAAPALAFYTGHQWDPSAVFATALGLLALSRGRDRWGALALAAAVSLKLFPLAFVAAAIIDRVRQRRFRAAAEIGLIFGGATAAINLPVALADFDGWSFFYRWNRDRLADSGVWVLFRGVPTEELTRWSGAAAVAGGLAITALAIGVGWRRRLPPAASGSLLLPLGATFLLWWLFVNKTFTTHLVLWVFLALALIRPAWWLWLTVVGTDLIGFQIGNYLNLYNIPDFRHAPLIRSAVENIYDPLQVGRSLVLLAAVGWGVRVLWRRRAAEAQAARRYRSNGSVEIDHAPPGDVSHALGAAPAPAPRRRGWATPAVRIDWRRLVAPGLALAGFVAATMALTWPYALHLRDGTLVGFDPLLQIWLSEWIQHALATDPLRLYEGNIFYPFSQTLAYTDANLPGALLAWPVALATGDPLLTNSLLTLATFPLAAGGMYALVGHLSGSRGAGFVAGLAYAFLPFRLVHLWHLNWLEGAAWLPWLVLVLLKLLERPTRRRALLLGGLVAAQTLTSFYFALQVGVMFCLIVLARLLTAGWGWRGGGIGRRLGALALAAVFAGAVAVPFFLPYLRVRAEQGLERSLEDAETYKARAESYLTLAPWDEPGPLAALLGARPGANESLAEVGQAPHADGHRHAEVVIEDALFPGSLALLGAVGAFVVAIVLIVAAAPGRRRARGGGGDLVPSSSTMAAAATAAGTGTGWRSRRAAPLVLALGATTGAAGLLSLGPSWGPGDGSGPALPYRWLFDHAPFFTAMRVPARLGGVVGFALVAMAGVGAAWAWRWLRGRLRGRLRGGAGRERWVGVGLAGLASLLVLGDLAALPVPLETVDRGAAAAAPYEWLAEQPDDGAVMEFPAQNVFTDPAAASVRRHVGLSMFWSTRHWKPLVNGGSGFIPVSYLQLLDAFVGELPRPDGSTTEPISHVDARSAALLQQLGVRWLVVHRPQYRAEDWPAVEAALAGAEGAIEPMGERGDAALYRVRAPLGDAAEPALGLYAPTLLGPGDAWAPALTIAKPGGRPAFLALTQPSTLTTAWYDAAGRLLWRGERRLPLPTIVGAELIRCSIVRCAGVATGPDGLPEYPEDLPDPRPTWDWHPTKPGHYVARLAVEGDRTIDCTVDVDVVADPATIEELAPDEPWRWAACGEESRFPTNNPGAPAFRMPPPSVTFVGGQAAIEATLATRQDEEIRAWFLLAPPGSAVPWREWVFRSPERQRLVEAGEPAAFDWFEPLAEEVPPGVYGLTIWFHRRVGGEWEHAEGGGAGLAPVVVEPDGGVRWAGPVRLTRVRQATPRFAAGRDTVVELAVSGTSRTIECRASWRLMAADGVVAAAGGTGAGGCDRPRIAVPERVAPGRYRLEIVAEAVRDGRAEVSDAVSMPVSVGTELDIGGER